MDIQIRNVNLTDLSKVANLHVRCFKNSFSSLLGKRLLEKYYKEYLIMGNPFVIACGGDKIVGCCMGYYAGRNAQQRFLTKYRFLILARILLLLMSFNKMTILRVFSYISPRKIMKRVVYPARIDADLLSIFVDEECRGTGVASMLVSSFENCIQDAHKRNIILSVEESNERAMAFYIKCGFSRIGQEGKSVKMFKSLT